MNERIFHYTKGFHMKKILSDNLIKLSKGFTEYGELSCVSVTTNQVFEKSILPAKIVDLELRLEKIAKNGVIKLSEMPEFKKITDMVEASNVVKGFYRIEISPELELLNWKEYRNYCKKKNGRINEKYFNSLEKVLYENSSLYNVLFSMKTIHIDKWVCIEKLNVENMNWSWLTINDVKNIMQMEDIELIGLTPVYPSMEILDVFYN